MSTESGAGTDFGAFVRARWAGLVDMLVAEGVDRADAEQAVADVLVRLRRGWRRTRRDVDVDAVVPELVRERAGVPAGPPPDPRLVGADDPVVHLGAAVGRRRRGRLRWVTVAVVVGGLLVAAAVWWLGRPIPPEVERADNPVPVPWYAEDRLHLADVVVTLPDVAGFAPDGDGGVLVRDEGGQASRVEADGDVEPLAEAPEALAQPRTAPRPSSYLGLDGDVRLLDVVEGPDGLLVHLVELYSDPARAGGFVRLSESGRRGLVVCDADGCGELVTVGTEGEGLRLR